MKKIKLALSSSAALSSATMLAGRALAVEYDYSTDASGAAAVGIFAGVWIFIIIGMVIWVVTLIYWIFMLIDAFKRTNWKDDSQKTVWLVVLIASFLLGFPLIGALVYYFAVRRPLGKA